MAMDRSQNSRMPQLQTELVYWFNKCFVASDVRASVEQEIMSGGDQMLMTRTEIEMLEKYFFQHKDQCEIISKQQELWKNFVAMERNARSVDRLLNRNSILLEEERARKKLTSDLHKAECEAIACITRWEETTGRTFLVYGVCLQNLFKKQRKDFKDESDRDRIHKLQEKHKITMEESRTGSKPATPKRIIGISPCKVKTTPSKACFSMTTDYRVKQRNQPSLSVNVRIKERKETDV